MKRVAGSSKGNTFGRLGRNRFPAGRSRLHTLSSGVLRMAPEHPPVENEALRLYEFNIEDDFRRKGTVAVDSSLGVLPDPAAHPACEGARKH